MTVVRSAGAGVALALVVLAQLAHAGVDVFDRGGNFLGQEFFTLNAAGAGVLFFGFNAKQTMSISLVLDASGAGVELTRASATERTSLHEAVEPYQQLESTTATARWSDPASATIVRDVIQGLDLLTIMPIEGHGRLARHGSIGTNDNVSGPLDPNGVSYLQVVYVNAAGTADWGMNEGDVFGIAVSSTFLDVEDESHFGIGPTLLLRSSTEEVPIGKPIPGGSGLRGRLSHVSGSLVLEP